MKVIITESQYNFLINLISENNEVVIDLNEPIDLSKYNSIDEIIRAVKSLSLRHGKGTQSRNIYLDIDNLLSSLENISDKNLFNSYIKIIMNLISKYKSGSYTLKKLQVLLDSMLSMGESEMLKKMEDIINIYDDSRFEEKHKKSLFKELEKPNPDFLNFYNKTIKKFREYELSFVEGSDSPFTSFFTSPRLSIELSKDLNYLNVNVSKSDFNEKSSDVEKVNYLISKMVQVKSFSKSPNEIISEMISMLSFKINFNFSEKNVKADLKVVKNLLYFDPLSVKTFVIAKQGQDVEIKNNPYNKPYYLSEFFKVDATKENEEFLMNGLSYMPKMKDVKESFKVLMESLSKNLRQNLLSSDMGEKIINHLTENLAGMIFSNSIFIPKDYIKFYWNNVGYANKPRLSIYYEVVGNPIIFKLQHGENGFEQYLKK